MAKTVYLTYYVNLPNRALADSLIAQYPDGVVRAPYNPVGPGGMAVEAANLLRAADPAGNWPALFPIIEVGDVPLGQAFAVPSLHSLYFDPHSNTFPRDVATFTLSSGWWIFGKSTKFYWVARFQYLPVPEGDTVTDTNGDVSKAAAIPARYYIDGCELLEHGEGSANSARGYSRAGATADEGIGFAYRNGAAASLVRFHQYPASPARNATWLRTSLRLRKLPAVTTDIFRVTSASTATGGARLAVTADGKLAMYVTDNTTLSLVSVTTGQLVVGKRQKLDVLVYIGDSGAGVALCTVYYWLDGLLIGMSSSTPGGSAGSARITDLQLGSTQGSMSTLEIDFDSSRTSPLPDDKLFRTAAYNPAATYVLGDLVTYTGTRPAGVPLPQIGFEMFRALGAVGVATPPRDATGKMATASWIKVTESTDWTLGSRVVLLDNTGFASSAGWTGDYRLASAPYRSLNNATGLTSSTSAALVAMTTNAVKQLRNVRHAVGWAAINVGVASSKTAAAADGSVGYKIGAAAPVYAVITGESTAGAWTSLLYAPAALQEPEAFVAVEAHYLKGADANASRVGTLMATVEVLGAFSDCDAPPQYNATTGQWEASTAAPLPVPRGTHNAPYWDTPWFLEGDAPLSPIVLKGGTYVGNGTGQDLTFPAPPHFITFRALSGDAGGARYFSAAPNLQKATGLGAGVALGPGYARRDPSFVPASSTADQQLQFLFSIGGADAQINANGVTYQYVAYMDPGARFNLCGASYHEAATGLLPLSEPLEVSNFVAEWAWLWRFDQSLTTSDELWTKGAGHTAAQASKSQTGTPTASAVTFNNGSLEWNSGFVDTASRWGTVFSLWRKADGNNDADQAKVWCHGTYVGDGNASRTVPISPASGLRPLYACVQPLNANPAIHRDPSHTGTTSSTVAGTANASTGITAGAIDGFVVGSALNTNAVTYNWFCLLGSATAGNGGWSANGTFTPIASDTPVDPTFLTSPDPTLVFPPSTTPAPPSGGGTGSTGTEPDLATACVAWTQKVVNVALSHIGVSKPITDLAAETTQEAFTSRLHIKDDVEAVLYRFPWRRAKRYANLVLVGGTTTVPVNNDWQYSYRAPTDMVRARRITSQIGGKRQYDPNPVAFEVGSDDTGDLIFTDAVASTETPVQLEYTARLTCPASQLGQAFRDVLAWRHAASLAPALSKDPQKAQYCEAKYRDVVITTDVIDAAEEEPQKPHDGDPDWIRGR